MAFLPPSSFEGHNKLGRTPVNDDDDDALEGGCGSLANLLDDLQVFHIEVHRSTSSSAHGGRVSENRYNYVNICTKICSSRYVSYLWWNFFTPRLGAVELFCENLYNCCEYIRGNMRFQVQLLHLVEFLRFLVAFEFV